MFTFPKARTGVLVAAALVLAGAAGCKSSSKTSTLPQASDLQGFDDFETPGERAPSAKTLYRLAQLLESTDRFAQAEAVLVSTIDRYEKFSPAYSALASIQLRTSQLEEAIHTLEAGLAFQPNDPVLHNNLGLCMMMKKEYELAHQAYNTAWTIAPSNTRYAANTALALGMMGRMEESRAIYQQIMSANAVDHNMTIIYNALDEEVRAAVDAAHEEAMMEAAAAVADDSSVKTVEAGSSSHE